MTTDIFARMIITKLNELEKEYAEESHHVHFDRRDGRSESIERMKIILSEYTNSERFSNKC